MAATPALDVVEVLLGTATDPALTTAAVAWGLTAAGGAVGLGTGGAGRGPGPDPRPHQVTARTAWATALVGAVVQVAMLLAGGATLTDRRFSAAVATLLVAAVLLTRGATTAPVTGERVLLGGAVLVATAAGAPTAGDPLQLLLVAAAIGAAVLLTALLLRTVRTPTARAPALTAVALVLVLGTPAGWLQARPSLPTYQHERVVLGDVVLDITVAPVAPGRNELHLYTWHPDGTELAVHDVEVVVDGEPLSRHPLLEVTPNHHLSYVLELPPGSGWTLGLTGATLDGSRLHHDLEVTPP